jgi:hypothetical protein
MLQYMLDMLHVFYECYAMFVILAVKSQLGYLSSVAHAFLSQVRPRTERASAFPLFT